MQAVPWQSTWDWTASWTAYVILGHPMARFGSFALEIT
jgi:hypothetical protein